MKAKKSFLNVFFRLLQMVIKADRHLFYVNYTAALLDGIFSGLILYAMQYFFDCTTKYFSSNMSLSHCIKALLLFLIIKILWQAANGFYNYLGEYQAATVSKILCSTANQKVAELEAIQFENTTVLTTIEKAYQGIPKARNFINSILTIFISYLPNFIIVGIFLVQASPILLVLLFLIFIPVLISNIIKSRLYIDLEEEIAPTRRKTQYYEECLTKKESFKEIRTYAAYGYFRKNLSDVIKQMNVCIRSCKIKAYQVELISKLITLAGYGIILILLVFLLLKGNVTVGAFAAIFTSLDTLFTMMDEMIHDNLSFNAEAFGQINNFLEFVSDNKQVQNRNKSREELKSLHAQTSCRQTSYYQGDITLEHVFFSYEGTDKNVLTDISFLIKAKQCIAIVGENGSGKSTLVKLISGLYSPDKGIIKYNNKELEPYIYKDKFLGVSTVVQNFGKYKMTLRENIKISDYKSTKETISAIKECGWKDLEEKFPDGEDTMLAKEYGGIDLSGGQWQKIAIARGFYKPHQLMILDEPTSAIDPLEENRILEQFMKHAKYSTTIIVTHRMSSVKFADKIVVLKKGKLVGFGEHKELIESCNEYQRLWNAQKKQLID